MNVTSPSPITTANYVPPGNADELVLAWLRRARESQLVHYEMGTTLSRRGYALGTPVVLLTGIVGTSTFASIGEESLEMGAKILLGSLSIAASVLASLQTFFKFAERAERHKLFAAKFGAIRRELEEIHATGSASTQGKYLTVIREKLDRLAEEAPAAPQSVLVRIQARETK